MREELLSAREGAIWCVAFLFATTLLVTTRFSSDDPDSALYAAISDQLGQQPVREWIAPQWWGHWNMDGLFREHPAGVFLLPTALGRLGIPPAQGAYVVGIGTALGSLLLIAMLVARAASREDGRAVLVLLQWMPVAFIFRI